MKLNQIIIGIVPCLSLALTVQAAPMVTTLDWQFSAAANPAPPTTEVDPSGGTATATFSGALNSYYFNSILDPPAGATYYGSPTGLWDVQNGQLELKVDRYATAPLDYTLVIRQFVDSVNPQGGTLFPGLTTFSVSGAQLDSRTTVVPQTGSMLGWWVADTYKWTQTSVAGLVTLDITPGASGSGQLLLDEVQWTITGDLTATVPEPMPGQMAAAGLLLFGICCWFRRKARA
jgi:hypothetical protein